MDDSILQKSYLWLYQQVAHEANDGIRAALNKDLRGAQMTGEFIQQILTNFFRELNLDAPPATPPEGKGSTGGAFEE